MEDGSWELKGTNLRIPEQKYGNQDYELWLRKNLTPKVTFDIEEFDYKDNHIVMFIIPAAVGEPTNFKNEAYVRIGSNLTKLKDFPEYLRRIYSSQVDWSAQIIENADIDDLDLDAIAKARQLYARKHANVETECSDEHPKILFFLFYSYSP